MQQMYRMFYVDLKSNLEALENGNFCNIFLVEHICIRYLYIFPILLRKKSRRKTLVCQSSCLWEYWLYDKLLFNAIKKEVPLKLNLKMKQQKPLLRTLKYFYIKSFIENFLSNHSHADQINHYRLIDITNQTLSFFQLYILNLFIDLIGILGSYCTSLIDYR